VLGHSNYWNYFDGYSDGTLENWSQYVDKTNGDKSTFSFPLIHEPSFGETGHTSLFVGSTCSLQCRRWLGDLSPEFAMFNWLCQITVLKYRT
jgi:hypothetical protein